MIYVLDYLDYKFIHKTNMYFTAMYSLYPAVFLYVMRLHLMTLIGLQAHVHSSNSAALKNQKHPERVTNNIRP